MSKRNFIVMAVLLVVLSLGIGPAVADNHWPACELDPLVASGNAALDGGYSINGNSITFPVINVRENCIMRVGIASYEKFEEVDPGNFGTLESQVLFANSYTYIKPRETVNMTVALPACAWQADVFVGDVIVNLSADNRYGSRLVFAVHGGEFCPPPPTETPPPPPPTSTPPPPPPADPTWCSPGYWRQSHHLGSWAATGISPDAKYSAYFGAPTLSNQGVRRGATTDPTLWEVLQAPQFYGGEAFNNVGDLLSGAHPDVNFSGQRVENSCPLGR